MLKDNKDNHTKLTQKYKKKLSFYKVLVSTENWTTRLVRVYFTFGWFQRNELHLAHFLGFVGCLGTHSYPQRRHFIVGKFILL